MTTIVLLFIATLFPICGAFPTYEKIARGQQSNEFCATVAYPQDDPAAYVHLCYTPGKGITRSLSALSSVIRTPRCWNLGCLSPNNSHVDDSVLIHLRQNVLHARCAIYSQCVCYFYVYFCSFSSTTIAGTCIVAGLPRCLPSTMQNATPMTVTLSNEQHAVLFSATSCEPGKQYSQPN